MLATYDDAGNLKARKDAEPQLTSYQYDALSRVTLIPFHDGTTICYLYDQGSTSAIGKLNRVTDASNTQSRLTQRTTGVGGLLMT